MRSDEPETSPDRRGETPAGTGAADRFAGRSTARAQLRALAPWLLGALLVALVLRVPWLGTPLGNDEGGVLYIADAWSADGEFIYGDYFLDRPPALVAAFHLAGLTGGELAVRALGVLAVFGLVIVSTLLALELGGSRAARWAAGLSAVLGSSSAIGAVLTPAELLGALPSALSVLLLVRALRRGEGQGRLLFGAGLLAVAALTFKQSFGDALLAATAAFAVALVVADRRRPVVRAAGGYALGLLAGGAALVAWGLLQVGSLESVAYALIGFRLDGMAAIASPIGDFGNTLPQGLIPPLIFSGLLLVLLWSLAGLFELRHRPVLLACMAAWGLGGAIGVSGGGSWWSHYLIQLVPFATVTAALALGRAPRRRVVGRAAAATAATVAAFTVGGIVLGPNALGKHRYAHRGETIGGFLKAAAAPGDTAWVMYAAPNVLYYSGLRSPVAYNWSLMMRAFPGAERDLRATLTSKRHPTWVVRWEEPYAYGLDRSGRTRQILHRRYRPVERICGHAILLRNGVDRRPLPPVRGEEDLRCH